MVWRALLARKHNYSLQLSAISFQPFTGFADQGDGIVSGIFSEGTRRWESRVKCNQAIGQDCQQIATGPQNQRKISPFSAERRSKK